jgi:hypothetical protein
VLDAASDAILAVDAAGRLMFLNTAAERTFGYRRDELVGQPVQRLLPDDEQLQAVRKDGTRFPAQVLLSTVPTQWGRITTATVRDLSTA